MSRHQTNGKPDTKLPDWVIIVSQSIAYVFIAIPIRIFAKRKKISKDIHFLKKGTLIVVNHQSKLDPTLVLSILPASVFFRMLPVRFPTTHTIYNDFVFNPPSFPYMKLLGCFSIGETAVERMHSMLYMRTLLAKGHTILIFPEGGIVDSTEVHHLRGGLLYLASYVSHMIFVRIRGLSKIERQTVSIARPSVAFSDVHPTPLSMSIEEIRHYLDTLD